MNTRRLTRLAAIGLGMAGFAAHADCGASGWTARVGVHELIPTQTSHLAIGDLDVSNKTTPTLNLDYRFCEHYEVDVLGSLPVTHGIKLNGSRIGSTQHLPPTVSLRWHPLAASAVIDPYVGVGVNYTMFRNESLDSGAQLKLDNSLGVAFATGVDWKIDQHWLVGVDARYFRIKSDAHVNGGDIGSVKINPVGVGATVGYRF